MDVRSFLRNQYPGGKELPPHRIRATLRLDGRLVTLTSRRVFRRSPVVRSWLEKVIQDLECSHTGVELEEIRLVPEAPSPRESPVENPARKRVVFVLEDGRRVKGLVDSFDPLSQHSVCLREVDAQDKLIRFHDIDAYSVLAAFFVEDLSVWRSNVTDPEPDMERRATPVPPDAEQVELTMLWGETMRGDLRPYDGRGLWYEFFSIDPQRVGNLKRALISRRAIARKRPLHVRPDPT